MRCFIAIELPETIRQRLADVQERLSKLGPGVHWTRPEQIHITVKFLGQVPEQNVFEVCQAAQRIAEKHSVFDLAVTGAGCFPPRGLVRILWAGITEMPPPLLECQRECEDVFADLGFDRENRAYSPHLTIGRVSDAGLSNRLREALREFDAFSAGAFTAEELIVFESRLRPGGAVYAPLARAPFKPL